MDDNKKFKKNITWIPHDNLNQNDHTKYFHDALGKDFYDSIEASIKSRGVKIVPDLKLVSLKGKKSDSHLKFLEVKNGQNKREL